jgi:hypothetical protein
VVSSGTVNISNRILKKSPDLSCSVFQNHMRRAIYPGVVKNERCGVGGKSDPTYELDIIEGTIASSQRMSLFVRSTIYSWNLLSEELHRPSHKVESQHYSRFVICELRYEDGPRQFLTDVCISRIFTN